MSSLALKTAVALVTVALLAGCGGEDDPGDSPAPEAAESSSAPNANPKSPSTDAELTDATEGSEETDAPPPDAEQSVAREPFCSDIDPQTVATALELDDVQTLVDEESQPAAPRWTCTIGQPAGSSVGVTWTLHDRKARSRDVDGTLQSQSVALGEENCVTADDEALGAGTRGIDCSRGGSGSDPASMGFSAVSRAVLIDGTLLECFLASTSADDLTELGAAAPETCGLFLAAVVS